MAISNWQQFWLLVWKNWLLQKRRKVLTLFQVLIPAAFAFILLLIRTRVSAELHSNATVYPSFSVEPKFPFNLSIPSTNMTLSPMLVYAPNTSQVAWRLAFNAAKLLGIIPNTKGFASESDPRCSDNITGFANESDLRYPDNMTSFANETDLRCPDNLTSFANKSDLRHPNITGFASESDLEAFFATEDQARLIYFGGLVFSTDGFDSTGTSIKPDATVKYKIRLRAEQISGTYSAGLVAGDWLTDTMFPKRITIGPRGDELGGTSPGYYDQGFLAIQRAVDMSIMQAVGGNLSTLTDVRLKAYPYPSYVDDKFIAILQLQFPFIVMLSFIITAPTICKDVVLEKEKKLKESMKLMGMKAWLHWCAWYFKFTIFMIISVAFMTLFYHLKVKNGAAVITHTAPSVTFVFLLLYSLATMTFCFAISAFFSKASAGAAAGGIIYLVSYFPYFFLGSADRYATLTAAAKYGISLVSNLGMAIGCVTISQYESSGVGVQWSNINQPVNVDDQFAMSDTFGMLCVDIIFYSLITWYVDALRPGDFGTPQPFYFPFTKWYWCGRSSNSIANEQMDADDAPNYGDRAEFFEKASAASKVGIKIRNLTKKFSKKLRPAVYKLNIDMNEGEITALLGHNGAGKTTTMFMLTGFLPPTSGTAYINGLDLRRDMVKIRESLGLCPQHDVLFDTMTVHEHLTFFARLKGCPSAKVAEEVDTMIKVLHLEDKRLVASKSLSGGMKRKLSVGIALISGSKFVILDEPTSGMDPEARRQAWDILQSQRAGRTMILSTHFMDEADLLGDRIAIMADGQLQCCGSSLFLKGKYGIGYHLTIVKNPTCDVGEITERIKHFVPEMQLESNVGAELSFILPKEKSDSFEELFTDLEENRKELGIDSFGASVTTLEEVFLKVGEMCDTTLQNDLQNGGEKHVVLNGFDELSHNGFDELPHAPSSKSLDAITTASSTKSLTGVRPTASGEEIFGVLFEKHTGAVWYCQQFYAMLIKHMIHSWRNLVVTITQLAVPVVFAIIACVVVKAIGVDTDPPALPLNLSHFDGPRVPFNGPYNDLGSAFVSEAKRFASVENTSQDMDNYLLGIAKSKDVYNKHYQVAGTLNSTGNALIGHFNNIALHAIAIALSMVDNALYKTVAPGANSYIETINHPLPRSLNTQTNEDASTASMTGFIFAYCVSFGMAFLIGTFVVFIINERSVKAKHSQFVSGVGITNFWFSTFLWDIICFLVPSVLIIVVIEGFRLDGYASGSNSGVVFFDLFLYGWSILPFVYLQSFIFNVASSGYVWVTVFNIFTGTAAVLTVYILKIPSLGTVEVGKALEWIFYVLLPNFCFNKALQDMYLNYQYLSTCSKIDQKMNRTLFCRAMEYKNQTNPCCPDNCGSQCSSFSENYLAWADPGIGRSLFFMIIQGFVYIVLVFVIDSGTFKRAVQIFTRSFQRTCLGINLNGRTYEMSAMLGFSVETEDDDVHAERQRITQTPVDQLTSSDAVVLKELTKVYGSDFLAVDHLSVGVPKGECFGLLGVNGAGKTTSFKMLTGDLAMTEGDAYLGGVSVTDDIKGAQKIIGYCPQFDALIDQMTVRETLWMFARLRGIKESYIKDVVDKLIEQLTLGKHAEKQAKNLSGGNRRKLSTGVALIGNPAVVFLDEPTTGMDPVARRLLWNTLAKIRNSGRTLILTSHSMEECEALCTRIAVMVNGRFQCLGSTQHLKTKFSEGYSLIIKVNVPVVASSASTSQQLASMQQKMRRVMEFVSSNFPESQLKDQHDGLVHYRIPNTEDFTWAKVFGTIERAKVELDIEDYSVSQTTLEQVFISFARMQREPQELKSATCSEICKRCCCCCSGDDGDDDE